VDALDPVALAAELIAIDSVNPSLVPGAAGERAIAAFCAAWLRERGFEVTVLEAVPGRPTVVGVSRGVGDAPAVLLNGHLDTVNASAALLNPVERDGRLIGRGAFDTKGGVAALMVAAARVAAAPHPGDLIVGLVADEEFGSLGTEELLAHLAAHQRVDAAIVVEPSQLELTLAHRGFAWFEIAIEGVAAHGSMPEQGVDAITHAGLILRALDELRDRLASAQAHALLAPGTVRVSTIAGGVDAATIAPACTLTLERRFLPGETPDDVEAQLRSALGDLLDDSSAGAARATLSRLVARGAFEADPESAIVRAVAASAEAVLGTPAAVRGEPFWTDAGLVAEAGIPCLVIGVAGGGAHADEEWATTASIRQLTDILEGALVRVGS
jgi:succinyl-diaminopimelate desuccinylase